MPRHLEFFDRDHFENRYHRVKARQSLSTFIDFFWETDFDDLFEQHPDGFSDALFPNIGYTYLINLGTAFVMQLGNERFEMKSDGFLPRYKEMICHHSRGNRIFGIKFKVSPVLFEKKINFSEYKGYIYPLSYLIDQSPIQQIKEAPSFEKRMQLASDHYQQIIDHYAGSVKQIDIVTGIIDGWIRENNYGLAIEDIAQKHGISSRSLQRYFEATTSVTSKQAFQILRIRKALEHFTTDPGSFDHSVYGYYDHSHFYKQMKDFVRKLRS